MSQIGPTDRPEHPAAMGSPMPMILCPYCGSLSTMAKQCNICSGYFDLLSRQRSQNAMGPWFVRDLSKPFQPGCSYATLVRMAQRGKIKPDTVLRGPSTRQFWSFARQTPGVAHLLGECHACHKPVMPTSNACSNCKASFLVSDDRQVLGLSPVHLLPGDADAETIARSLSGAQTPPPPRVPMPTPRPMPEPEPEPVDISPVPEPQVIVEEPEWIEEEAEESAPSRIGLFVAVFVVTIMMGGAGVWAWWHLSSRDESGSDTGGPAVLPVPAESVTQSPPEPELQDDVDEPRIDDAEIASETDESDSESVQTPAPKPSAENSRESTQRLAYDRILVGIADGSLGESELETRIATLTSDQQRSLRAAWERRAQQIRLGRSGE